MWSRGQAGSDPFVLSGEGTNCKGYQGHLDADWRDQVKEGLDGRGSNTLTRTGRPKTPGRWSGGGLTPSCKCILHIMLICHYCLIQVSEYPKESMDGLDATPGPASAGATVLSVICPSVLRNISPWSIPSWESLRATHIGLPPELRTPQLDALHWLSLKKCIQAV